MNALCALRAHRPSLPAISNRGIQFSRCARCGNDFIATDGIWKRVPSGYRVVWKSGRPDQSIAGLGKDAPPLLPTGRGLALAAILLEELTLLASAAARKGSEAAKRINARRAGLVAPPTPLLVHFPHERAENG